MNYAYPSLARLRRAVAVLALLAPAGAAQAQTTTFTLRGSPQTYTVPAGVTSLRVVATGASGGLIYDLSASSYSYRGRVEATVAVTPGEVLAVRVGGRGTDDDGYGSAAVFAGGYNGGGAGTDNGFGEGGGGGATDLRRTGQSTGDYLASRNALLVAGGGGGSSYSTSVGGNGGAPNGGNGGGYGGSSPGQGATQAGPGAGTNGAFSGSNGTGGDAGDGPTGLFGGGGGGGYYGGGGGSSWAMAGSSPTYSVATAAGDGELTITPTIAALTRLSPGSGPVGTNVTLSGILLAGVTGVRFNGTAATTFAVVNATTVTATVPVGATSGPVTVSSADGTSNGLAFVVGTRPNNALDFDGTNDYVALPATTPVPLGNSQYTIEAWIKPTRMGVYGIVGWGNFGTDRQVNALRLSPSGIINYWWAADLVVTTTDLSGRWHHVAATFDGTTRRIYLDGVLAGFDTPGNHTVPNASNLRIGSTCPDFCGGEFFPGSIDEVRVYNAGLTQAQVQADMFSAAPARPANLVLYYDFNEGTAGGNNAGGTRLPNTGTAGTAGTASDGTLTNFALTGTSSNWVRSFPTITGIAPARAQPGSTVTLIGTNLTDATRFAFNGAAVAPFATPTDDFSATVTVPAGATTGPVSLASAALAAYQGPTFTVGAPLPVQLVAFTAEAQSTGVLLRWHTASELNSARFEVEASTDGRAFARVGTVAGAGTSTQAHAYTLTDEHVAHYAAPQLYYCLRQVDADGTAAYSPVRRVAVGAGRLALFPNPAAARSTTLSGAAAGTPVRVYDALGRLVLTATADATGAARLALPASQPAGLYLVRSGTAPALRLVVE